MYACRSLSKAPLRAYHTTLKFAAVKALVFATPLQVKRGYRQA